MTSLGFLERHLVSCAAATLVSGELQTRQSQTLGELKELRERKHETRKASIIAVLAVGESAAEIVTWCNSG